MQPAGKKPITLDDFLSQPVARQFAPIWAPDGKRFAYKEKDNIYLYEVAARKAKSWFASPATSNKGFGLAKSPRKFAIVPMVSE